VEGSAQLRASLADARIRLQEWTPPKISPAVGLREMVLTPASANEVDRILAEPAKPMPAGPVPRAISPEEFRRIRSKG
jgi:hypothetical protein